MFTSQLKDSTLPVNNLNIFLYLSYLEWMKAIAEKNRGQRGYHKAMSTAAGCQPSFLSQVFRSKTHLTPDQAAGLSEFWAFTVDETEFFLSLVHFERSGSKVYRRLLKEKMEALRLANSQVGTRIQHRGTIQLELQARYYSDWYWAIIHIMTSVEKYQDPSRISGILGLDLEHVLRVLKELRTMNLVQQDGHRWTIGSNQLHLDRGSPFHVVNQKNFRHFIQNSLSREKEQDLHYCAAYGLSAKSYVTIREMLLNLISAANKEVLASKEEHAACITLDLVSL